MKKNDIAEIRNLSVEELQAKVTEAKASLMKARFARANEGERFTSTQRNVRRDIARLETIISEKQKAG